MEIIKWIFNTTLYLTNFEIHNHYQIEPRFNGVYSRYNLPRKNGGVYVINLDETLVLELIGLLCRFIMIMLLILIVLM